MLDIMIKEIEKEFTDYYGYGIPCHLNDKIKNIIKKYWPVVNMPKSRTNKRLECQIIDGRIKISIVKASDQNGRI